MNVLDLFSGIGGISLGLERAGMRTVAFCEINPYCQRVLRRHWPDVPVYGDIRELTGAAFANASGQPSGQQYSRAQEGGDVQGPLPWVDVICGGFPCQDISVAGRGAGIGGERSGLWSEYARIIGEVRPRYVIVENVAALLGRGLARVLGDLAALGFDAEWHCIPASAVGAPHRRDRLWLVAHATGNRRAERGENRNGVRIEAGCDRVSQSVREGATVADAYTLGSREAPQDGELGRQRPRFASCICRELGGIWEPEPDVGRVAHGVRNRVDRLRALGNAVVPQIPEIIGRAIMNAKT